MRIRHYDCFMHEHDIRAAVGAPPRAEVGGVRFSLDEVATGLGYIVGRRARLPDGALVQIEYKKGKRRAFENDDAQLCAQAMCLE